MNREILFRGFAPDENGTEKVFVNGEWIKGKWVEGDLLHDRVGIFICREDKDGYEEYKVLPETVGQYIGLTNRNGKKIFEGDIVKEEYEVFVSARAKEKRVKIGYVEYESNSLCCGYYAYYWNDKEKWRGNFAIHCGCQVIGNIHNNPELLKGEAE